MYHPECTGNEFTAQPDLSVSTIFEPVAMMTNYDSQQSSALSDPSVSEPVSSSTQIGENSVLPRSSFLSKVLTECPL